MPAARENGTPPVRGEHSVILASHWNRRYTKYPIIKYQAIFQLLINLMSHKYRSREAGQVDIGCRAWEHSVGVQLQMNPFL